MEKDIFDIIYLLDKEIGIASNHSKERPCLIVYIDLETEEGWVIPLSSKKNNNSKINSNQYLLSCGSWIDFSNKPIKINSSKLKYSDLAEFYMSEEDLEELDFRSNWNNIKY